MKKILLQTVSALTALAAVIDTHYGMLDELGINPGVSAWIKVSRIVLTALLPSIVGKSSNENR